MATPQIISGYASDFCFYIDSKQNLYARGSNDQGQLGVGDYETRKEFTIVTLPGPVKSVSTGAEHAMVLLEDGRVFIAGSNRYGQLGEDQLVESNIFIEIKIINEHGVPTPVEACYIHAGAYSSFFISAKDLIAYAVGDNSEKQLGFPAIISQQRTFEQIPRLPAVKSITNQHRHSLAIGLDGVLYGAGISNWGELGVGMSARGQWNNEFFSKLTWAPGDINSAMTTFGASFIINNKNELFVSGSNERGVLGASTRTTASFYNFSMLALWLIVQKITIGGGPHLMLVDQYGKVFVTGANSHGQLGVGDTKDRDRLTEITSLRGKVAAITCGKYSTYILLTNGTFLIAGKKSYQPQGLFGYPTSKKEIFTEFSLPGSVPSLAYLARKAFKTSSRLDSAEVKQNKLSVLPASLRKKYF